MSDEINELRAEMNRLQARIDEYESDTEAPVGRRNMLRALGAAGAGAAVGGLAFAKPTSAANGDDLVLGQTNEAASTTLISATGSGGGAFGALHVTNDPATSNANLTVSCISAIATGEGGGGQEIAFAGSGSRIGAKLDGPVPLKLTDSTDSGPPGGSGFAGQFKVHDGSLYFCVSGSLTDPVIWKKIVGPEDDTPEEPETPEDPILFNPVTPFRVYDSRLDMGSGVDGPLAAGASRTVSVADARSVADGTVATADAVPAGATAVTFYVAAIGANATGFLTVSPSDATEITAASLNFPGGAPIGSGGVTKLAGDREIKVFAGGAAGVAAGFTIDITGYYL